MTDLVPHGGQQPDQFNPNILRSIAEGLRMSADLAEQNRADIQTANARIDRVEAVAAENREYMTLRGFILRYQVRVDDTSDSYLSHLGMKATVWHRDQHLSYRQGGGFHQSYGRVNQYRVANLARFFRLNNYPFNETLYQSDSDSGR